MVQSQDTGIIQLGDSFKVLVQARNQVGMSKNDREEARGRG